MYTTDEVICKCKKVSFSDVEKALRQINNFTDLIHSFEEVQQITHCSTGCGGCHDKIMDAILQIMMH